MTQKWVMGIDIGKSHVASAAIVKMGDNLRIISKVRDDINGAIIPWDRLFIIIQKHVEQLLKEHTYARCMGIGICAPAVVDADGRMQNPNFPALGTFYQPLAKQIEQWIGKRCTLVNDGQAAAFVEWRFGAGIKAKRMAYFVVSSGVGGAYVLDGKVRNGEFGRIIVPQWGDGIPAKMAWLENYCNTTWFEKQGPYFEKPQLLAERADRKDPEALEIFERMG